MVEIRKSDNEQRDFEQGLDWPKIVAARRFYTTRKSMFNSELLWETGPKIEEKHLIQSEFHGGGENSHLREKKLCF